MLDTKKEYWFKNKDKLLEQKKIYYEANKDKINEKIQCDNCFSTITRLNLLRHKKTIKCQNYTKKDL